MTRAWRYGSKARLRSAAASGRHLNLLISSPYQQFIASDPFGGMYLAKEQLAQAQLADIELEKRLGAELARRRCAPWDAAVADGDTLSTMMLLPQRFPTPAIVSLGACDRRGYRIPTHRRSRAHRAGARSRLLPSEGASFDFDAPMMVAEREPAGRQCLA